MTLPPSVPRVVIEIPFEGSPRVCMDVMTFEEEMRLRTWAEASDEIARLIHLTVEIAEERRAA